MTRIDPQNLIWTDLEMTGLGLEKDSILEIAVIPTDKNLIILDSGLDIVIHQDDSVLKEMNEWAQEHHKASGLTEKVRNSTVSLGKAETKILDYLKHFVPEKSSPLCGSSVHMDRYFIIKYMPSLDAYLHYRNIDTSTIKELAQRWYPELPPFRDRDQHRALADIEDSIAKLQYYRDHLFTTK